MDVISEEGRGERRRRRKKADAARNEESGRAEPQHIVDYRKLNRGQRAAITRVMISQSAISSERPDGVKRHNTLHFEES